jgi:hypothetical protein
MAQKKVLCYIEHKLLFDLASCQQPDPETKCGPKVNYVTVFCIKHLNIIHFV